MKQRISRYQPSWEQSVWRAGRQTVGRHLRRVYRAVQVQAAAATKRRTPGSGGSARCATTSTRPRHAGSTHIPLHCVVPSGETRRNKSRRAVTREDNGAQEESQGRESARAGNRQDAATSTVSLRGRAWPDVRPLLSCARRHRLGLLSPDVSHSQRQRPLLLLSGLLLLLLFVWRPLLDAGSRGGGALR